MSPEALICPDCRARWPGHTRCPDCGQELVAPERLRAGLKVDHLPRLASLARQFELGRDTGANDPLLRLPPPEEAPEDP